jgi:hypothetical protein
MPSEGDAGGGERAVMRSAKRAFVAFACFCAFGNAPARSQPQVSRSAENPEQHLIKAITALLQANKERIYRVDVERAFQLTLDKQPAYSSTAATLYAAFDPKSRPFAVSFTESARGTTVFRIGPSIDPKIPIPSSPSVRSPAAPCILAAELVPVAQSAGWRVIAPQQTVEAPTNPSPAPQPSTPIAGGNGSRAAQGKSVIYLRITRIPRAIPFLPEVLFFRGREHFTAKFLPDRSLSAGGCLMDFVGYS